LKTRTKASSHGSGLPVGVEPSHLSSAENQMHCGSGSAASDFLKTEVDASSPAFLSALRLRINKWTLQSHGIINTYSRVLIPVARSPQFTMAQ